MKCLEINAHDGIVRVYKRTDASNNYTYYKEYKPSIKTLLFVVKFARTFLGKRHHLDFSDNWIVVKSWACCSPNFREETHEYKNKSYITVNFYDRVCDAAHCDCKSHPSRA